MIAWSDERIQHRMANSGCRYHSDIDSGSNFAVTRIGRNTDMDPDCCMCAFSWSVSANSLKVIPALQQCF